MPRRTGPDRGLLRRPGVPTQVPTYLGVPGLGPAPCCLVYGFNYRRQKKSGVVRDGREVLTPNSLFDTGVDRFQVAQHHAFSLLILQLSLTVGQSIKIPLFPYSRAVVMECYYATHFPEFQADTIFPKPRHLGSTYRLTLALCSYDISFKFKFKYPRGLSNSTFCMV